jgi:Flp pilus assembly protein TadD
MRNRHIALMAVVAALAILPYLNSLRNGFVLDDVPIVVENPLIRDVGNVGHTFGSNYWDGARANASPIDPGLYRPLTIFSFAVDYSVWKLNATGYHVVNVVLHTLTTLVVFFLAVELLASPLAAAGAAAVFAVHPLHTEAVTSIVGRAELLGALFFTLAFWLLRIRPRPDVTPSGMVNSRNLLRIAVASLCYLLGMLSKEVAVTLPAVLLLDDWLRRDELRGGGPSIRRNVVIRYAGLAASFAIYLALRFHAVSERGNIWPGFLGVSSGARFLTASRVLAEYLGLFVFPHTLLADYWTSSVPIAHSPFEPRVLLSIVLWLALGVLVFTKLRRERAAVLALGWFFITVAPVSNIFFPIGVGEAERILYLPSIALCLLVGWIVARSERLVGQRWILPAALAPVLLALAARTVRRNADWHDNLSLALATLETSPSSPLMNDIAAGEFVKRGQPQRAVPLLQEALRQAPTMPRLRTHLGAAYHQQGQLDQAIEQYTQAIQSNPHDVEAHTNLGVAYLDKGRVDEGVSELTTALQLNPTNADAHNNLGTVYLDRQQTDAAIAEFKAALRTNAASPETHNNLGVALLRKGELAEAAELFRQALALRPDYASARQNLNSLMELQSKSTGSKR